MHHLAVAVVNDRRADERAPSTTRQRLARAVAQHSEHPALDRLGGWRGLERELRVDLTRGLDGANGADLTWRRTAFQPPPEDTRRIRKKTDAAWLHHPRWRIALSVLGKDPPTVVLWVAAIGSLVENSVSLAAGDRRAPINYTETGCLFVIAALMASVRIATEWQKQSQLRELLADTEQLCEPKEETTSRADHLVEVLRCGEPSRIPREELCVGDLLLLRGGDDVGADGLVVPDPLPMHGAYGGVRVVLTGSTTITYKTEGDVVLAGTRVVDGAALMVVLAVGAATVERQLHALGDASKRDQEENCRKLFEHSYRATHVDEVGSGYVHLPRTPRGDNKSDSVDAATRRLQQVQASAHARLPKGAQSLFHAQVARIQSRLASTGLVAAGVLLAVLVLLNQSVHDGEDAVAEAKRRHDAWFSIPGMVVSVIIVTSTDSLALVLAMAVSAAVRALRRHRVLFHDVVAAETPGSMTVLCVEPRGTLTTGELRVARVQVAGASGSGCVDLSPRGGDMHHLATLQSLALCTIRTARFSGDDAIDRALLQFVSDTGGDVEKLRVGDMGRLFRPLPISTVRKWMAVAAWETDDRLLVAARGDARTLLGRCAMVRTVDGPAVALDDAQRHAIQREMESLESAGYRVVAMAHRELEAHRTPVETVSLDNDMTLLAWVALEDILRPNTVQAVGQIQRAGVTMCLVTADALAPTLRVARQCGVLSHSVDSLEAGDSAMSAPVFRELVLDTNGELRQDAFDRMWPTLRVLANASAADKYLVVKGLQAAKQSVGMFADGDHDALALCASDVAITTATAATGHAAKIVLLDKNLESLGVAITWGRIVKTRLLEFTRLQLTTIIVALVVLLVGSITLRAVPLTMEQLFWLKMLLVLFVMSSRFSRHVTEKPHHVKMDTDAWRDGGATAWIVCQVLYQLTMLLLLVKVGSGVWNPPSRTATTKSRRLHATQMPHLPSGNSVPSKAVVSSVMEGVGRSGTAPIISVVATPLFNTLVWMHLFAQLACHTSTRLPLDERSRRFYVWWAALAFAQVVFVQFLADWTNCEPLTGIQWLVCVTLGAGTLAVDYFVRAFARCTASKHTRVPAGVVK